MRRNVPMFYSALLLTLVNLLLRLVGTSFQVYISGRIGPAGVGLLQLTLSVASLAMIAGMAGVRTGTMYLTAGELGRKKPENVRWVLSGCFCYSAICSLAVAALCYCFAPWIAESWIGDGRTVGAIRLFASFLPVTCLCGVMTGYFTAAGRIGTLAAVEVAEQLFSMGVTVGGLTLWAGSDPGRACQTVILGSCAGSCLTLCCLVVLRLREKSPKGPAIPVAKKLLSTAVPLALADDLKAGISTTENLMVPRRLALYPGASDPLALFGLVSGMVFPVMMFPAAILYGLSELLIPELARCNAAGSKTRIDYLVRKSLRVAMLYGVFFCGELFLLSDGLCQALYHNADAGHYLRLFCLTVPMLYCDSITDAMTKGLGQQKICVRYNILTSGLDVAFLFILLPKYGMNGYFVSFILTHLLNFILSLRLLLKITKCHISFHIPALTIAAGLLAGLGASFVTGTIFRAAAYIALLGALLTLMGILSREDLAWIRGLIRRKEARRD